MTKRIVLCADDYGQAEPISKAIITLIQHGRVTATSCMVNSKCWTQHAKWLLTFKDRVDIGLHFNLTEGKALSRAYIAKYGETFFPLSTILRKSLLRQIDRKVIEEECKAQIDQFQQTMGFLPNFIDGHQHVHQFPVIRDALINVYNQRLKGQKIYIRLVNEKVGIRDLMKDFKKIVITATGTSGFQKLLNKYNIPHNQSFAGIYSFANASGYKQTFSRFLAQVSDGGLIMCHPGLPAKQTDDVIAKARYEEYQYLFGGQFLLDCYRNGATLGRFEQK